MGFLDDVRAESKTKGPTCSMVPLLAAEPELQEALADDFTSAAISRALRKRGHKISGDTIARHRNGECACEAG